MGKADITNRLLPCCSNRISLFVAMSEYMGSLDNGGARKKILENSSAHNTCCLSAVSSC